jgi:hypothetical protein
MKPGSTQIEHYKDSINIISDMTKITEKLSDPAIAEKFDASQISRIAAEGIESSFVKQLMVKPNIDPKVKELVTLITDLRNKKYLDNSGKAVTGGEALRNFMGTVQPTDSAADVAQHIKIGLSERQGIKDFYETLYPSLVPGGQAMLGGAPGATQRSVGGTPMGGGNTFASEADVEAAVKAGKVKKGDRITVNGQTGTWQ